MFVLDIWTRTNHLTQDQFSFGNNLRRVFVPKILIIKKIVKKIIYISFINLQAFDDVKSNDIEKHRNKIQKSKNNNEN